MEKLNPGAVAPNFSLIDKNGNIVKLSDFKGKKVLVYFYPKADTSGCTKQACNVRDRRAELARLKVGVVGVSPDMPEKQRKFDDKYKLGFPLLSDPDHAVAEAWGSWGEKTMYGRKYKGVIRSSFLVDEKGRISRVWYGIRPDQTVAEAQKALRVLRQ